MIDEAAVYLVKAEESLAGAESEFANGRFNNCANRSYYAAFQVAVAALIRDGIRPAGDRSRWGHAFVQSQFAGQLITRRKRYPAALRDALARTHAVREEGDCRPTSVSQRQATRSLADARAMVATIAATGGPKR